MVFQLDLSGIPSSWWIWGSVITALGGVCVRLIVSVRRLRNNERVREETDTDRRRRDQEVWDAWKSGAETQRQQLGQLASQVQDLQAQSARLYETIFSLNNQLGALSAENSAMRVRVEDLQKHNSELREQVMILMRGTHATDS